MVRNSIVLPTDFELFTNESLSNIKFADNVIRRIISSSDPDKAHGHDLITIRMLKICGDSINKLLGLIFRACLENGIFPKNWKKANVFLFIKKRQAINKEL